MGIENGKEYIEPKETSTKTELESLKQQINLDQKTIQALSYLTTFFRLDENRDLDELFDGEVKLGEEELLSIYSLIEIINGSNKIISLKTPRKMNMDVNWNQDYSYDLEYNNFVKDKTNISQISTITGSGTLPFNECKLQFNHNQDNQIENIKFKRPRLGFEQKIIVNRENGLVNEITIQRDVSLDNKLTIKYNHLGKPELVEQTKVGLISDKMAFEYDEKGNLISIIYVPALSLKNLKGVLNAGKKGANIGGALKGLEMAGEYVAFTALKKLKGVDYVEIVSENGLIKSTKSDLNGSEWIYKKGFSENKYSQDGQLEKVYLEKEDFGPDDKKSLTIQY